MGAWADGLLDNDCSLDGLLDLAHGVVADVRRIAAGKPSATAAGRLAGAIGVLLQIGGHQLTAEAATISAALTGQARAIARLPAGTRRILAKVAAGEGEALARRPAKLARTHAALLHAEGGRAFGPRMPALFASASAAAYVQTVARRCVAMVAEDFADEDNWSDLCREGIGIGGLAALLVLSPCRVPLSTLAGWRRKARAGLAELVARDDEELEFHRGYYAKLERVLGILMLRFSRRA